MLMVYVQQERTSSGSIDAEEFTDIHTPDLFLCPISKVRQWG